MGKVIDVERRRTVLELKSESGTVTLLSTKRKRETDTHESQYLGESNDDTIVVSFLPRRGTKAQMLTVTVSRQAFANAYSFAIAHISANNIIPNDSHVFKVVEEGRTLEFQQMLREGKASLRDHDELGRPLVYVSSCRTTP